MKLLVPQIFFDFKIEIFVKLSESNIRNKQSKYGIISKEKEIEDKVQFNDKIMSD